MPLWLTILLAATGGLMTVVGTVATVVNVRGSRHDAGRKAITDELILWRDDTKALRERLKATEDRCDQLEEQCKLDLAERGKQIRELERRLFDLALELAQGRRGGATP